MFFFYSHRCTTDHRYSHLQAIKYNNATTFDDPIDAPPTDAATSGNQFRLTGTEWRFNLST